MPAPIFVILSFHRWPRYNYFVAPHNLLSSFKRKFVRIETNTYNPNTHTIHTQYTEMANKENDIAIRWPLYFFITTQAIHNRASCLLEKRSKAPPPGKGTYLQISKLSIHWDLFNHQIKTEIYGKIVVRQQGSQSDSRPSKLPRLIECVREWKSTIKSTTTKKKTNKRKNSLYQKRFSP